MSRKRKFEQFVEDAPEDLVRDTVHYSEEEVQRARIFQSALEEAHRARIFQLALEELAEGVAKKEEREVKLKDSVVVAATTEPTRTEETSRLDPKSDFRTENFAECRKIILRKRHRWVEFTSAASYGGQIPRDIRELVKACDDVYPSCLEFIGCNTDQQRSLLFDVPFPLRPLLYSVLDEPVDIAPSQSGKYMVATPTGRRRFIHQEETIQEALRKNGFYMPHPGRPLLSIYEAVECSKKK